MRPLVTVEQFLRLWVPLSLALAAACVALALRGRSARPRRVAGPLLTAVAVLAAWPVFNAIHEGLGFDSVAAVLVLTALFGLSGLFLGRLWGR